jgi:hypothetical protein
MAIMTADECQRRAEEEPRLLLRLSMFAGATLHSRVNKRGRVFAITTPSK